MVERGAPNGGGSRQNGPSVPEIRAMYGAPLGPEEEASTVSEYVATLQGGHEGRGHEPPGSLGTRGGRTRGAKWWWQPPKRAERARDKAGINKEGENGGGAETPASPGGGARPAVRAVEAMDHPI